MTDASDSAKAYVLGGSADSLAITSSFGADHAGIPIRILSLATTPIGLVVGDTRQSVGIAQATLLDWIDRSFPGDVPENFVAPLRDVDLLMRTGWHADEPETLDEQHLLNIDDLPPDVLDALGQPAKPLVQCGACKRLCVRDEFVWKEKPLCAWDYHAVVFGKRGPWRNQPYEERHFATLPRCRYVAAPLVIELNVDVILTTFGLDEALAREFINRTIATDETRAYLAVRIDDGFVMLRERSD